ncbi:MAG: hypothetical protein IPM52_10370 [Bacteroidetes bacterium]|nr:hypothetical protein [Bacteroidota bacterium]
MVFPLQLQAAGRQSIEVGGQHGQLRLADVAHHNHGEAIGIGEHFVVQGINHFRPEVFHLAGIGHGKCAGVVVGEQSGEGVAEHHSGVGAHKPHLTHQLRAQGFKCISIAAGTLHMQIQQLEQGFEVFRTGVATESMAELFGKRLQVKLLSGQLLL